MEATAKQCISLVPKTEGLGTGLTCNRILLGKNVSEIKGVSKTGLLKQN